MPAIAKHKSVQQQAQEKQAVQQLNNLWSGINNSKVRKNWFPVERAH